MKKIRTIFMGTPLFAVPILESLMKLSNVVAVVTKKDAIVGRKKQNTPSPVKEFALKNNIDVLTPDKLSISYNDILAYKPDLIITCAYGKILPKIILDYPKYGSLNIHASLLPKYRGSAPIQWALINGEKETGVTLMYMDEGMDTGDIIDKEKYIIKENDDVGILHNELSKLGEFIITKNFDNIINNNIKRVKQNDDFATNAPMIKREMELLNFNNNGVEIINKIKAFSPWPLTRAIINNEEIKIVKAHFITKSKTLCNKIIINNKELGIECADGIVYLDIVKPVGKKEMNIISYLNGLKNR